MAGCLYVVATPIGNLEDITLRALRILRDVTLIAAEDTRRTRQLLNHFDIHTPAISFHDHSAPARIEMIINRLSNGDDVALVSDAGTPLVSDPGFKLVADAAAQGTPVIAVPGASAVLAALVVAGLPTDRFFFEGFLPSKSGARRQRIGELSSIPGTLVFFESPRRLAETLNDLAVVLGRRDAAIARELTKHFETVRRGTLRSLADQLAAEDTPKGEIVLLVGPPGPDDPEAGAADLDTRLIEAMKKHSVKDAASVVAAEIGLPRRRVYARAIVLASETDGGDG